MGEGRDSTEVLSKKGGAFARNGVPEALYMTLYVAYMSFICLPSCRPEGLVIKGIFLYMTNPFSATRPVI